MLKQYIVDLKQEFKGYNTQKLSKDILAGLTVAAVALPLALAFGVSSGADAAAGLITAIISGVLMSTLSGASYQISGPTGAMTAILIGLVAQYQMEGVFIATLLAGIILIIAGVFKIGKLISLIPAPVITGFTSGIAVIIATGQIDNFFGVVSEGSNTVEKLMSYGTLGFSPNIYALMIGVLVIVIMMVWPKKWNSKIPSSLVGIIAALGISLVINADVAIVGDIPKTLLPATRLHMSDISLEKVTPLLSAAVSIAALGMIESLLCGASAGRMKNEKLNGDRELIAQGVGNIVIPFFGGVPSTAAIARTSVAIKSGAVTRLTGVFHAVGLLISMFLLGDVMSKIPLSALAGVLMVTAWRMNEWDSIKLIFSKKLKTAIAQFIITMLATIIFDLTIAIMLGVAFSICFFMVNISGIELSLVDVDPQRLSNKKHNVNKYSKTKVAYLTGPVFFTTSEKIKDELALLEDVEYVILSMRGVPLIDATGIQVFDEINDILSGKGIKMMFSGVQPKVKNLMERSGFVQRIGDEQFFWDVEQSLMAITEERVAV